MFAFTMNGVSDNLAGRISALMPDAKPRVEMESILSGLEGRARHSVRAGQKTARTE
jgi:hypothetical protein